MRNHRQPAVHVSVQRAIAHRQLGLVAGRQQQRPKLVGQPHQQRSTNTRLNVFFRDIGFAPREGARQGIEDYVEVKYLCLGGMEAA